MSDRLIVVLVWAENYLMQGGDMSRELGATKIDFHALSWNPAMKFYDKLGCIKRNKSES